MSAQAKEHGKKLRAVVDCTGFDGFAVVGSKWLKAAKRGAHAHRIGEVRSKADPVQYVFGGGTAVAGSEVRMQISLAGVEYSVWADVVTGSLPCLLGREFGTSFKLWIGCQEGEVWSSSGKQGWSLVAKNGGDGLMLVGLDGSLEMSAPGVCLQACRTQEQPILPRGGVGTSAEEKITMVWDVLVISYRKTGGTC